MTFVTTSKSQRPAGIWSALLRRGLAVAAAALAIGGSGTIAPVAGTGPASMKAMPGKCELYGRIQVVQAHPDVRVERVSAHADIHVQWVDAHADRPGRRQRVNTHPDYRVQFVEAPACVAWIMAARSAGRA